MSVAFAALGEFGDAISFIFNERESQAGTVQVGGLGEKGGYRREPRWAAS